MEQQTYSERFERISSEVMEKLRQLLHEGAIRRIVVKQGDRTIAEFPLAVGVVGAVFAPALAAVGALTALVTDCAIEIERTESKEQAAPPEDAPVDIPVDLQVDASSETLEPIQS
jgi:hypothetical protein